MRPLVGITGYVETARWREWDAPVTLLPQRYVTAVHAAGGRAVVVPPSTGGADRVVAALDALVLAGGGDIGPRGTAPRAIRRPPAYGRTGTPGRWRCWPPRPGRTCRCWASAEGCR